MNDSAHDIAKAVPAGAVYVWQLFGHPISEVVSFLTAVYLGCLITQFVYRFCAWVHKKLSDE